MRISNLLKQANGKKVELIHPNKVSGMNSTIQAYLRLPLTRSRKLLEKRLMTNTVDQE